MVSMVADNSILVCGVIMC